MSKIGADFRFDRFLRKVIGKVSLVDLPAFSKITKPTKPVVTPTPAWLLPPLGNLSKGAHLTTHKKENVIMAHQAGAASSGKVFKIIASVFVILAVSLGLSAISVWQKNRVAEIEKMEAGNAEAQAQADLTRSQADLIKAQAKAIADTPVTLGAKPEGGMLRPSEVPVHLRAPIFPAVLVAVPCTAGGVDGFKSEGFERPMAVSSGFELDPGKCFFGKPTGKMKQISGSNAFMELYDTAGILKERCEFSQASVATCSSLHDKAITSHDVIRFGARFGGFIKYWV